MRSVLEAPAPIERTAVSKLPVGRPAFLAFVADAETDKLLHECVTQLALGQGTIMRGGIAKAIEHLGQHRSPHILIVDVSGIDLPVSRIHELAEVCEPGVAVIAIGNRNEIGLYRDLLQAGVADYVVKPLNTQLLAKALASGRATGEASPIHKKLGTMVAFVGTRGGVGTTTLAVNMAWYLANRQSRRVALVDLDLQNGDCALALDIKPTSGLREALANPLRIDNTLLERVMTPVGERLFVLSSEEPLSDDLHFTAVAVETLVSALREQFHYVIVDVPRIPAATLSAGARDGRFPCHRRRPDIALGARHRAVAHGVRRGRRQAAQYPRRQSPRRGRTACRDPAGVAARRRSQAQERDPVPADLVHHDVERKRDRSGTARQIHRRDRRPRARTVGATARAAPLVEGRQMRSASFGRRIIEPSGHELVLVPGQESPARHRVCPIATS